MATTETKHTLEDDKRRYLLAFLEHRLADVTDRALNGNTDAVSLLVFYIEQAMGGAKADEQGIIEYWRALRKVEDALQAENLPF